MAHIKKLASLLTVFALLGNGVAPLAARSKKGDKLVAEGRVKEARKDWDGALEIYEQALSQDPADPYYQLCADRARFQAAQAHVTAGLKIRSQGNLTQALIELQKAFQIDPSSSIAEMEIRRTQEMINREKKKVPQPGVSAEEQAQEAGLTPAQAARKHEAEKLATIQSVPELKPLKADPINLVLRNQPPKVLFETVGKVAGINVLFDADFVQQSTKALSIDITNSTLDQALDYLSILTKAFWKPLSQNTIFVTQESTTKRRDYEEQVMKVFYLNNVNTPQELQEIVTTIRSVADLQRIFVYNAQNAIIARGEADRIALAEKIINDLDKPRSEVVVDIIVLQSARNRSRDLAAAVAATGINIPIAYTPGGSTSSTSTTGSTNGLNQTTTGTTTTTNGSIPLSRINRISTKDFSVTLPGGILEALMSDSTTRILQSPQVRAVDGMKAVLKIGQKVPTASGSFQPGIGGVGINPLVNTQFTYIDVGVNVDMTPHIHDGGELDLHVEVEISSVDNHVNLGGIDQPVIGQRKVTHDIRMREGQVNLLGGLMQMQETKTKTGVPGIGSIPIIGRLFSKESLSQDQSELLIALVPHIIRRPEITAENLKGIAVGNQTVVKLSYGPRASDQAPQTKPPAAEATPPATAPAPAVVANPPVTVPSTATAAPAAPPPPVAVTPVQPPVAVPAAPAPAATNEPPKASVMFAPPRAQTAVGGSVSLNFVVNNAVDFFSTPLTFTFDPKIVRLNDVIRGGVLSEGGVPPAFTKNIQNDSGTASVSFSRGFGMTGVNGNGILLTLVFQGVASGSSSVTLPQVVLRDSKANPIPMQSEQPPQAEITVR